MGSDTVGALLINRFMTCIFLYTILTVGEPDLIDGLVTLLSSFK